MVNIEPYLIIAIAIPIFLLMYYLGGRIILRALAGTGINAILLALTPMLFPLLTGREITTLIFAETAALWSVLFTTSFFTAVLLVRRVAQVPK